MPSSLKFWARTPKPDEVKIAVIGGAGKMGRWLAGYLRKEGYDVIISDRNEAALRATGRELDVATASSNAEAVRGANYVILSVPLESFEEAVAEIHFQIQASQTVIDITSVKAKPVEIMRRHLGKATVLGVHPLFGPGASGIANQNFVLTPTSQAEASFARKVRKYLEGKNARVTVMTPAEHDEVMSRVLGLSHFIAIVAADTLLSTGSPKPIEATTSTTYKVLLTMIESVLSEDPDLYATIQMNLPRAAEFEKLLLERTAAWAEIVATKNRPEFVLRFKELRDKLKKVSPDFDKAYDKMYHIIEGL